MTAPIPQTQFEPPLEAGPGWSPECKVAFLDYLAQKGNVRTACRRVGLSREAAYCLRRRDPLFARGWAAALVHAREASVEVLADRALDGIEEPIFHRGELVGTRRKYDTRLLLAHLARLDKQVGKGGASDDAERFDDLLARIGEAPVPTVTAGEDDVEDANSDDRFRDVCEFVDWASGRCPDEDRIFFPGQCQECQPGGVVAIESS